MPYRDDETALRLRVAELEHQLASAEGELMRLRGGAAPDAPVPADWLTGEPRVLALERRWNGPFGDAALQAVAAVIEARAPAGWIRVGEGSLRHRGVGYELGLTSGRHETVLRLERRRIRSRWRLVLGALFAWLLTVPAWGVVAASLGLGTLAYRGGALATMVGSLVAILALVRRDVRDEHRRLTGLFEACCDPVQRGLLGASGTRLRLAVDPGEVAAEEAAVADPRAFAEQPLPRHRRAG